MVGTNNQSKCPQRHGGVRGVQRGMNALRGHQGHGGSIEWHARLQSGTEGHRGTWRTAEGSQREHRGGPGGAEAEQGKRDMEDMWRRHGGTDGVQRGIEGVYIGYGRGMERVQRGATQLRGQFCQFIQ